MIATSNPVSAPRSVRSYRSRERTRVRADAGTELPRAATPDPTRLQSARAHAHLAEGLPGYREIAPDLLSTSRWQYWWAFARLPLAIAGFFVAAELGAWWACPVFVFLLLSAVVNFTHDVAHGSVGKPGWLTEVVLFLSGLAIGCSGHAYRITHLQHHSVFPERPDPEGDPARWPLWRVVATAPVWLLWLWWWAFRRAKGWNGQRAWMIAELLIRPAMYAFAIALWTEYPPLLVFVVLVHGATLFFPYTTVYLPHHGYGETPVHQTGTMRGVVLPRLFFEATFHLEHHLYPMVPAHHLRELSGRLEPELWRRGVVPTRVP